MLIATAFGAGYMPKAPGTAGSVAGVLLFTLMVGAGTGAYYVHAILFLFFAGIFAAQRVETFWGHDSQRIVIDEVIGQMIALFFLATSGFSWTVVLIGFALFRAFDITKPFPVRHLERLPGGLGVIADDVGAGFYALLLLTWLQNAFGI